MQEINAQYRDIIKNPRFKFSEQTEEQKAEYERYPDIIDKLATIPGIVIELIGNWIWVSGNTYPHRQQLKELGFMFAPKKTMWYFRPAEYKSGNHKPKDIDEIRAKYGSETIRGKARENEIAA